MGLNENVPYVIHLKFYFNNASMIFVPIMYLLGTVLGFYFLKVLTNDLFMLSEIVFYIG